MYATPNATVLDFLRSSDVTDDLTQQPAQLFQVWLCARFQKVESAALHSAKIFLHGCFRIETADGIIVPVKSAKSQGLLALLAASPKGERSRQWLQAKLWSDRGPEQAAGSLRQELAQLRKVLVPAGVVLDANRQRVALDLGSVAIAEDCGGEFLEGLDVRDDEFELWLAAERMRRNVELEQPPIARVTAKRASQQHRPWTIAISSCAISPGMMSWFEELFCDALARSLRELFSASVAIDPVPEMQERLSAVKVHCFRAEPGAVGLRVTIDHPASRRRIWSGHRHLPARGVPLLEHPVALSLVNELVEALGQFLVGCGIGANYNDDPDLICCAAIQSLFTMRPQRLTEADAMFARAFELSPRAVYLAWRAQVRAIQKVEKHCRDLLALTEEARHFMAHALETEPNNSMVLALLANAHGQLMAEHNRSLALARRSVLLNPGNPMGWWALSSASVYTGQVEDAYKSAVTARNLALLSPHRYWWDNQQFGASLVLGRIDEALRLCELAHAENPHFRPPLRYLIGLYANQGRYDDASSVVARLKEVEPDFEVDRLIKDRDYPASLLHRTPGLAINSLKALL